MSKILINSFAYRWRKREVSYYFGKSGINNVPDFEPNEKIYFLNQIIVSLLIHEKIILKMDFIEELELLIGIENVLRLFNQDAIEIIDDGGTMVGFLVDGDGKNLLMNFSDCSGLKIDAIEERLDKKYNGKVKRKTLNQVLLNVENRKIDIDGAWAGHLVEQELFHDLNNNHLVKLLDLKSENYTQVLDKDILAFMRLCYLNRSLIYQNDVNADFLLTEGFATDIVNAKISPLLRKEGTPDELFVNILTDKGIPDLATLIVNGIIKFEHVLELRNSFDGKKFRLWYKESGWDKKLVYKELMSFNSSIASENWVKIIRWIYPKMVGLFTNGIAGVGTAAFDTFIVGKLLKGWHPNFFLDNKLTNHIDSEIINHKISLSESRTYKRLGMKVGRNEKCPCQSGKKLKNCCGKI